MLKKFCYKICIARHINLCNFKLISIIFILLTLCFIVCFASCTSLNNQDSQKSFSEYSEFSELSEYSELLYKSQDGKIHVKDLCGRDITLNGFAGKICALSASDVEVLFSIDAQDSIVGRGSFCDYPSQALNIKEVGSGELTNIEEIFSLKPDVVLMSKMSQNTTQIDTLQNAGIPVIVNEINSLEDMYKYIELLSFIVNKQDEGKKVIDQLKCGFESIKEKSINNQLIKDKTIYFEVANLQQGLWVAGNNTFVNDICKMLEIENIFGDTVGWTEVSQEQIINRNPEFIVSIYDKGVDKNTVISEIKNRKGWENINAVKNNKVFVIDSNIVTRPGPRLLDAANEIYNEITK